MCNIKIDKENKNYQVFETEISQGSVLFPYSFLIYTADIPATTETSIATFANYTGFIALDQNAIVVQLVHL